MKDVFFVENSKSQKKDFSWVFTERVTNSTLLLNPWKWIHNNCQELAIFIFLGYISPQIQKQKQTNKQIKYRQL